MKKSLCSILILSSIFMSACSIGGSDTISSDTDSQNTEGYTETASEEDKTAIGTWILKDDTDSYPSELVIESPDEAYYMIYLEQTNQFKIDSDKKFYFNDVIVPETDYTFENKIFRLSHDESVVIEMEKADDSDEIAGKYILNDCLYKEHIAEDDYEDFEISDDSFCVTMSENKTILSVKLKMNEFKMTNDTISSDMFGDGEKAELHYEIDRDTLIVTPEGKRNEFIRKK